MYNQISLLSRISLCHIYSSNHQSKLSLLISVTLYLKGGHAIAQFIKVTLKKNLIKIVEDNVIFQFEKGQILIFSPLFLKHEGAIHICREAKMNIISSEEEKYGFLIHQIRQSSQGTVLIRKYHSIDEGSFETTFTIPIKTNILMSYNLSGLFY